jgi:hypothetical protein
LCGLAGGEWCPRDSGGTGPEFQLDQREDDGRSLCFDSAPLAERLEVLGQPKLSIKLSPDQPQAMLAVRLCDVAPDGHSSRVTFGLFNLCHRNGHGEPRELVPGEELTLTLSLKVVGYAFRPGHRIRLALSGGYWPMAWPSPRPVTFSVTTGASSLALPLCRPDQVSELGAPFEAAESAPPLAVTQLAPETLERRVERSLGDGTASLVHREDSGPVRYDGIDLVVRRGAQEGFHITEGDPLSATAEMRRRFELQRGELRLATDERLALACDARDFIVTASLEAFEDDTRIFSRQWHERIPRDQV